MTTKYQPHQLDEHGLLIDKQVIFDRVVRHLAKQQRRAIRGDGSCRYRHDQNGVMLKCAAGIFIPDDKYYAHFENLDIGGIWNLLNEGYRDWPFEFSQRTGIRVFVSELQKIHDTAGTEWVPKMPWNYQLLEFAVQEKLDRPVLKEEWDKLNIIPGIPQVHCSDIEDSCDGATA